MTDRPIVFLDTETNGLHADRRPWEIAWIRREVDGTETERCIQIADIDNTNAELKGLQVGRFHERFKGGPKAASSLLCETSLVPHEQRTLLLEWDAAIEVEKATRDAIIVGDVHSFDTEVLAAMLRRHKLCPSWYYNLVDVETLAAGWLRASPGSAPIMKQRRHAQYELVQLQGKKHRTYSDATSTMHEREHVDQLVAEATENAERVLQELSAVLSPDCRSDDLSRACGVEPPTEDERHTALGDARWVKRWYDHIMGGAA